MTSEQKDLLHALTFLYLRHGQNRRALSLIMLAARRLPDDPGLMRTLAFAFIANGAAEEALEVLERLDQIHPARGTEPMRYLMKARALLHAGRIDEAKALFRQFVEARKSGALPADGFPVMSGPIHADVDMDPALRESADQVVTTP